MSKATIKRLMEKKLLWGIMIMVLTQILGILPTADYLPQLVLKPVCLSLGIFLTVFKGVEMYYEKSIDLESSDEDGSVTATTTTTTETKLTAENKQP